MRKNEIMNPLYFEKDDDVNDYNDYNYDDEDDDDEGDDDEDDDDEDDDDEDEDDLLMDMLMQQQKGGHSCKYNEKMKELSRK